MGIEMDVDGKEEYVEGHVVQERRGSIYVFLWESKRATNDLVLFWMRQCRIAPSSLQQTRHPKV